MSVTAPPDTGERTMCPVTGKRRFRSPAEADARRRYLKERDFSKRNMMPYRCRHCGGWHLGHSASKKRDR